MTFVARHLGEHDRGRPRDDVADEIPLDAIRPAPAEADIWETLSKSIESLHKDIVVPFASVSSRPLILQCQPFRPGSSNGAEDCRPLDVRIVFPATLIMEWEGEVRLIHFACADEKEWTVDARLVDSVAIFESGYIGYSVAFVFGEGTPEGVALNAQALLALASLANPAGRLIGEPIRIVLPDQPPVPADVTLQARLRWLSTTPGTVFTALAGARRPRSAGRSPPVFSPCAFPTQPPTMPATPECPSAWR